MPGKGASSRFSALADFIIDRCVHEIPWNVKQAVAVGPAAGIAGRISQSLAGADLNDLSLCGSWRLWVLGVSGFLAFLGSWRLWILGVFVRASCLEQARAAGDSM
jgi:hypothetical protein